MHRRSGHEWCCNHEDCGQVKITIAGSNVLHILTGLKVKSVPVVHGRPLVTVKVAPRAKIIRDGRPKNLQGDTESPRRPGLSVVFALTFQAMPAGSRTWIYRLGGHGQCQPKTPSLGRVCRRFDVLAPSD